ncbi:hypothetical protein [Leptospira alexanderi]|uniref:Uncharacterized protein n=1 Tax=Leptospira alexanderi serovar Manhao 3 str. L 60 TaxID=1049759 RepID=V6I297_9LEPT|nr:hypothetical protein [Leptospira alexanderi]EQA63996.1 hypothetical protein LEP1GSC062_0750 [Leptospira alexanderi serovar Manhao 3 str. L 60]
MIRLMAIASALLEKNVVYESALRFKDSVRRSVLESTPELCWVPNRKLPHVA